MNILLWSLLIYFIATTIAFVVGVGPTPGNPRECYWWERVLTFPFWLLSVTAEKIQLLGIPIYTFLYFYSILCYPLVALHEKYEMWKYNRNK